MRLPRQPADRKACAGTHPGPSLRRQAGIQDTQAVCAEKSVPPLSHLAITCPSHLPDTHTHTRVCTYSLFFLRCVCTRLPGCKSFSGMDECLQPIHHPPYPPPSPLFLYQSVVTLSTDAPLSVFLSSSLPSFPPSQVCPGPVFCFFPMCPTCCARTPHARMLVGVHARLLSFPPPALPPPRLSLSIYLSLVHRWDLSGTFRAAL